MTREGAKEWKFLLWREWRKGLNQNEPARGKLRFLKVLKVKMPLGVGVLSLKLNRPFTEAFYLQNTPLRRHFVKICAPNSAGILIN